MISNQKISILLLMGGTGSRFDKSLPKQFHLINNKKIYLHTLDVFYNLNIFSEIILICHKDWIEEVKKETSEYKNIKVVEGGETRQQSSYLGLLACNSPDYVLIHDSVRPFVSKEIIKSNIESVIKYDAVNTCIDSADTIVCIDEKNRIASIPNRNLYRRGQTPQSFKYDLILKAHKKAKENNIENSTDDCSLVIDHHNVHVVTGSEKNIKITHEIDLLLAKNLT